VLIVGCDRPVPPKPPRKPVKPKPAEPQPPEPPPPAPKPIEGDIKRITTSDYFEYGEHRLPEGRTVLRMTLRLDNPNPHPLEIEQIAYTIRIGSRTIAATASMTPIRLPADGHAIAHLDYREAGWPLVLKRMGAAETAPVIEGYIHVRDALPPEIARRADFYFEAIGLR
jgi:hypothetical protein